MQFRYSVNCSGATASWKWILPCKPGAPASRSTNAAAAGIYPLTGFSTRLSRCAARQAKLVEDLAARNTIRTTLDPLLLALSRDYVDDKDLTHRLKKLFKVITSRPVDHVPPEEALQGLGPTRLTNFFNGCLAVN